MNDLEGLLAERERRRCTGDGTTDGDLLAFTHFCAKHITIRHPQGKRKLILRDAQLDTIRAYVEHEQCLVLKARQIGFTTVTMIYSLWRCLFHEDFSVIALSKKEDDAKKAMSMARYAYDLMGKRIKSVVPTLLNDNLQTMKLSNGSAIECYPSLNNPARGSSASLMVLDEWGFMPNPDEAWASVEPVTDVGGRLVALSTANGVGNLFHKMWVDSERGANDFHQVFFPYSALPERDHAWWEAKSRSMPEWQLHQEYPRSADEAFIKSGNAVFPSSHLAKHKRTKPERGQLVGSLHSSKWYRGSASDSPMSVYEHPKMMSRYVIGADTAQGLDYGDYSSAHVLQVDCDGHGGTKVVATWHGHIQPDLYGYELFRLGMYYNSAVIGVEYNNHGSTTNIALRDKEYPHLFIRTKVGGRRDKTTQELGWYTSKGTKPKMVDDLAAMTRDRTLHIPDGPTLAEMRTYVRKADGQTEGSPHDDRVISLAIAVQMIPHARSAPSFIEKGVPVGSFDWHLNRLKDSRESEEYLVGRHVARHM